MAIITFKSNETKETAQTLSLVAVAAQMAIEHNYKILVVSTNFKDRTLEECFWENEGGLASTIVKKDVGIDSGVEGLIRIMSSNKTNPEIIKNYTKIVLKERLDILPAPKTTEYREYESIAGLYPEILQMADRYYDLVIVDLCKKMDEAQAEKIIQISDVIMVNLTQRLRDIDNFIQLREEEELYRRKHIMLLIGRYDIYSKYNVKNITRYLKEKKPVGVIPYNTLYFEACSEGKVIDFFLKMRNVDQTDRNHIFMNQTSKIANDIIYKLQELQMKL